MIKETLKRNGFTLSQFADSLNITRPTLNSYINLFEQGYTIPNEKYQLLFDSLFGMDYKSCVEFREQLENANYLIERDSLLGTMNLGAEKTDILSEIIESCKQDLFKPTYDINLYKFIVMFVNSYYENNVFQHLAKYFLTLNGFCDVDTLNQKEKIAISNYYNLFKNEVIGNLQLDILSLNAFYKRVYDLNSQKESKKEAIKKEVDLLISEKIEALVRLGIDIDDIDTYEMIKRIMEDI